MITGKTSVAENYPLNITCYSNCKPVCTYKWKKDGQVVGYNSTLLLSKVGREVAGNYTCTAQNVLRPTNGLEESKDNSSGTYIDVAYGPDYQTGSLISSLSITKRANGDYLLVAEEGFETDAVTCGNSTCHPQASCSYRWDSLGNNTLRLGRLSNAGKVWFNCTGSNREARVYDESVALLEVCAHGKATNITKEDVTAHSVLIKWTPGYSCGFQSHVQPEYRHQRQWLHQFQNITDRTNNSARLWWNENFSQATEVRVVSWLDGYPKRKAEAKEISVQLDALPNVTHFLVYKEEDSATIWVEFAFVGGDVDKATVQSIGTDFYEEFRPNVSEVNIVNITSPEGTTYSHFRLELYDGPDRIYSNDSIVQQVPIVDGGGQPGASIDRATVAGTAVAGVVLLVAGSVLLVLFIRKRRTQQKAGDEDRHNITLKPYSDNEEEASHYEPASASTSRPGTSKGANSEPLYSEPIKLKKNEKDQLGKSKSEKQGEKASSSKRTNTSDDGFAKALYSEPKRPKGNQSSQQVDDSQIDIYEEVNASTEYANQVEFAKDEEEEGLYGNLSNAPALGDFILDYSKEHEEWVENADGLLYADLAVRRPAREDGEPEPIHRAPDNTVYSSLDFNLTGAASEDQPAEQQ